jgi:LCP family protein required for cell wall assembly
MSTSSWATPDEPGGPADPPVKRPVPHWAWRLLCAVGLACVLLAVAGLLGVRLLTERYDDAVGRDLLLDARARTEQSGGDLRGPLNYLVVGSDLRASDPGAGQRADTILIAHIPASHDRAYLISVPRDLLTALPAYPPTGYPGGRDKINSAFQFASGGTQLLSAALTHLAGIRFDGAAIIDFSGFRRIIDLLGGITMCVDQQVRSTHTGHLFPVGCQRMTGARALDFARQRHDLPDGDWDRQRHHQQLLKATMDEATDRGFLTNPFRLDQLIREVGSSLTVDTNGVPLTQLIFTVRGLRSNGLVGVRIPGHDTLIEGVSYVVAEPAAAGLFTALRLDELDGWTAANPNWVNRL